MVYKLRSFWSQKYVRRRIVLYRTTAVVDEKRIDDRYTRSVVTYNGGCGSSVRARHLRAPHVCVYPVYNYSVFPIFSRVTHFVLDG